MFSRVVTEGITKVASIKQYDKGFRAQVAIMGMRKAKSFRTKREAAAWAAALETEIRANSAKSPGELHTLADAMLKYRDEVSPTKRGQRWEEIRIDAMLKAALPVSRPISSITPGDIALWRDDRLRTVGNGTVLREIGLLSSILEMARREWRWISVNPVTDVRKPRQPDHRETVLTRSQIKGMLRAFGYSPLSPIRSVNQSCAVAMLLALRTGMRAGELCKLEWVRVHDGYCRLLVTKTVPRDVPLTPKAMRLIEKMRGFDKWLVFGVTSQTLDTLFRRARGNAGIAGVVFHDTRHTAATWLAKKLHVLALCKVFGWSSTKQALTYYNPTAAELAADM